MQGQQQNQDEKTEYEKLRDSPFKQQTMKVWRPQLNPVIGLITFGIYTIVFFMFGAILKSSSDSVVDVEVNYNELKETNGELHCKIGSSCTLDINVDHEGGIKAPVYFYYQLENFYQNQRDYVKSRDYSQQKGTYKKVEDLGNCKPITKVEDLFEWQQYSVYEQETFDTCQVAKSKDDSITCAAKKVMDLKDPATPCGLVAKSFFNDKFSNFQNLAGTPFTISEEDIAWATDKEYKFKNVDVTKDKLPSGTTSPWVDGLKEKDGTTDASWKNVQWIDMTNEHFIVWMRYAGLPTFRKLYGKVDKDIPKGKYTINIDNKFDVAPFEGKKSIVFSTTNSLGGKSYKLATCFFIAGSCTALYWIFLAYKTYKQKQKTQ